MDRGFREWYARLTVTYLKGLETDAVKNERTARLLKEEEIKTRCRRCGWTAVRWFYTGVILVSFLLGAFCALLLILGSLGIILGTTAFVGCAWTPPDNQCLLFELRNETHVIWSNEVIWEKVVYFTTWQQSISVAFEHVYGTTVYFGHWKTIQSQVCSLVEKSGLNNWKRWAGIYKIH